MGNLITVFKKVVLLFSISVFLIYRRMPPAMKLMIDVMEVIGKNYVSETNTKDLTASAIKGVVSSLGSVFTIYGRKNV